MKEQSVLFQNKNIRVIGYGRKMYRYLLTIIYNKSINIILVIEISQKIGLLKLIRIQKEISFNNSIQHL